MLSPNALRAWFLVHKWTSLVSTLFLLLLCVTGLPLIFAHEIDHALGHSVDPPELAQVPAERASVDAMIADAQARYPDEHMQFVVGDPDDPNVVFVRMGASPEGSTIHVFDTYDARTGEHLVAYPLEKGGFMEVMERLHVDLYAGLKGTLFLGSMGLFLLLSLVSGVVLYGRVMRKLRFGTVREKTPRLRWLDLHNLLGIGTLVWLLVVGTTGTINALAIPIFQQWQATELAEMTATHATPGAPPVTDLVSVDTVLANASAETPGKVLSFLAFPGNEFASPQHFVAFMAGAEARTERLFTAVMVDAATGDVREVASMPWYTQVLFVSQPLHFGDYGGLPLKVLWALLDLLAIVVLGSGVYLWLKKRNVTVDDWLRTARGAGAVRPADAAPEEVMA
ncbi:PepSY-associated TM helix domain-containing protein [Rubrivirga sp. IMCC43871]|uniref:PepSY-associated TM helix domain-containing protein n=1 Tax=Rubrivirga sp. IMCC43871 TaxID=3391575 RepID=UPI00399038BF